MDTNNTIHPSFYNDASESAYHDDIPPNASHFYKPSTTLVRKRGRDEIVEVTQTETVIDHPTKKSYAAKSYSIHAHPDVAKSTFTFKIKRTPIPSATKAKAKKKFVPTTCTFDKNNMAPIGRPEPLQKLKQVPVGPTRRMSADSDHGQRLSLPTFSSSNQSLMDCPVVTPPMVHAALPPVAIKQQARIPKASIGPISGVVATTYQERFIDPGRRMSTGGMMEHVPPSPMPTPRGSKQETQESAIVMPANVPGRQRRHSTMAAPSSTRSFAARASAPAMESVSFRSYIPAMQDSAFAPGKKGTIPLSHEEESPTTLYHRSMSVPDITVDGMYGLSDSQPDGLCPIKEEDLVALLQDNSVAAMVSNVVQQENDDEDTLRLVHNMLRTFGHA